MNNTDHYKILHEYPDKDRSLVMNEVTGDVCMRKILKVYDKDVFMWLKGRHLPHVSEIMDVQESGDQLIVTERFVNGMTLDDYIRKHSPDLKMRLRILSEICDGLYYLHTAPRPIIHRDIKAANIIVDDSGHVTIIDFDAAKTYKAGESCDTVLLGTEGSAAPEQYGFAQSDPRTDIYSLGVLAKALLPSAAPYDAILRKATAFDPKDRYQDIASFKNALFRKPSKSNKYLLPLVIVLICFMGMASIFAILLAPVGRYKNAARLVVAKETVRYTDGSYTEEELQELIDSPDYYSAEEYEYALNHGKDTQEEIVRFEVESFRIGNVLGYPNVWGGEHLNFVSSEDPYIREGDIVTVRICAARNVGNRWFISYELLNVE
ncbi:MAG: protein kinase [Saccharofermentans sp.]|nr:protein kinase [Saccharofermentans sp.]